ncbi:copper transporter [Arcanobacterium canis]
MVDFRYHLVSLVSVFLALAIGVILGAGPLQNSIGTALSHRVEALSDTNATLASQNEALTKSQDAQNQAMAQLIPSLSQDALVGKSVAFVVFPGAQDDIVSQARDAVTKAGAKITGTMNVNETWTSSANTAFRTAFAAQVKSYVVSKPEAEDPNTILGAALTQVVISGTKDPANADLPNLLTGAKTPLVTLDDLGAKADAVVIITADTELPGTVNKMSTEQKAQMEYDAKALAGVAEIIATKAPTVVFGAADSANDVARVVREAKSKASTVDSPTLTVSQLNVVLALVQEFAGKEVNLGFDDGVSAAVGPLEKVPSPEATSKADAK